MRKKEIYMEIMVAASGKNPKAIYKFLWRHGLTPINQESVITFILFQGEIIDINKKAQHESDTDD